jgi:hydroxymethylglutaryl-CoA lyase
MIAPARPARVTIVEVGPRDGLQNEPARLDVATRVAFIESLADAGCGVIEVGAFVHPGRVPQMAGTADVVAGLSRRAATRYAVLVPNDAGLDRALAAGAREIAIFAAASETFSRRNINQSVDESLTQYRQVVRRALDAGLRVRGYLSTCFGCPYEGEIDVARVVDLAERMLALGVFEVAVSDTIGVAHPGQVEQVLDALRARLPAGDIALHFHDTRGTAVANVLAALPYGITTFDTAAGGLGGCPFAPGASGNLATEDLLYVLHGLGIETGISLDAVVHASLGLERAVGHALPSRYLRAIVGRGTAAGRSA